MILLSCFRCLGMGIRRILTAIILKLILISSLGDRITDSGSFMIFPWMQGESVLFLILSRSPSNSTRLYAMRRCPICAE